MSFEVTMKRDQMPRSGLALGGLGAGWFEIRQDGGFRHWEIFNNEPLFTGPKLDCLDKNVLFFIVRAKVEGEEPRLILLQIEDSHDVGAIEDHEAQYMFPWLSGVDSIHYRASFPFAELTFEKEGLPLEIHLQAWSPFIPNNAKDSALPLAYFDFEIANTGTKPIDVQIVASLQNLAGYDQPNRAYKHERVRDGDFSAFNMANEHMDPKASSSGTMTLASLHEESIAYLGWAHHHPYYERFLQEDRLPEFDDTEGRNKQDDELGRPKAFTKCFSSIGRGCVLEPGSAAMPQTFILAWHFPNLYGNMQFDPENDPPLEGHYYQNFFENSEEVARYGAEQFARLEAETWHFYETYFDSSLPAFVLDQVNSQLNTFRTSTWFTKAGDFGVLEGLSPYRSFAGLATTDVAMYGHIAASLLFPELDRAVIRAHLRMQNDDGSVIHSIKRNFRDVDPRESTAKRLDMPGQFVFQALRCALWENDREFLEEIWPAIKKALAYVMRERDKNGDNLPDMEGIMCSYDNFPMYGVAPYVCSQWLAAVGAALYAGEMLGDEEFLNEYRERFKSGVKTLEETTWTGDYFRLYSDRQEHDPTGRDGCLSDQIIGQWAAHQLDLPRVIDEDKTQKALDTIMAMNYKPTQGLRNCQWPGDEFLHAVSKDTWIDQANTCWTGVELAFAGFLLFEGKEREAWEIVKNIDDRHRKWGIYWDHQEFGGHYFRPMSALAIPNSYLGLRFHSGKVLFRPAKPLPLGRWCFLLPGAYGSLEITEDGLGLALASGEAKVNTLELPVPGTVEDKDEQPAVIIEDLPMDHFETEVVNDGKTVRITFKEDFTLTPQHEIRVM